MYSLYQKRPMAHALFWLVLYLVVNTITGNLAQTDAEIHQFGFLPNLLLALVCFVFLYRTGISQNIGLTASATEKSSTMLYYLPLFVVPCLSLLYGLKADLPWMEVLTILGFCIGVGFMEEIIFRGLMFEHLSRKWGHRTVLLFISFTFAFGHIISIAAVGMSGRDTFFQIVNAFVVGFLFMIVMITSRNLAACVLTHILYNFFALLSNVGNTQIEIILLTAAITIAYTAYLWKNAGSLRNYLEQPAFT